MMSVMSAQFPRPVTLRFLLVLLWFCGLRVGEALGLRRSDLHLVPTATTLGCSTPGPHVHVVARSAPLGNAPPTPLAPDRADAPAHRPRPPAIRSASARPQQCTRGTLNGDPIWLKPAWTTAAALVCSQHARPIVNTQLPKVVLLKHTKPWRT